MICDRGFRQKISERSQQTLLYILRQRVYNAIPIYNWLIMGMEEVLNFQSDKEAAEFNWHNEEDPMRRGFGRGWEKIKSYYNIAHQESNSNLVRVIVS